MENEKIDFVIPFVNSNDPLWQEKYIADMKSFHADIKLKSIRFRDWDNLKYLFRGVANYMPWINNVYLILSQESQKPEWLNETSVKVIYHKDIIPKEFLPTYNSCCIEMFLGNIPNLADKFLYANDDMFPINPCFPEDFFKNGKPITCFKKCTYSNMSNIYRHQCRRSLDVAEIDTKMSDDPKTYIWKSPHSIAPILKSTCIKMLTEKKDLIYKSISPLRETKNMNQYLYTYWQYAHGLYVEGQAKNKYVEANQSATYIADCILDRNIQILCLNDSNKINDFNKTKNKINAAFNKKMPDKCKYEN